MKFDDEICKGVSCHECSFNKGEDGCLLAERLDEIDITPESCEEHTETHSCDYERTGTHDWIPVTERQPNHELAIVQFSDGDFSLLQFPTAYRRKDIVAWMPMPEPPEVA